MKAKITRTILTDKIPSGSSISVIDDQMYIVGDDAEFIQICSLDGELTSFIKLHEQADKQRVKKLHKLDLEASALYREGDRKLLFIFGSGSIIKKREKLFIYDLNNKSISEFILGPIYDSMRDIAGLDSTELNIESAAFINDKLLLLNRGEDVGFLFSADDFLEYVMNKQSKVPGFDLININFLPVVSKYKIGFSGLAAINHNKLVFTASLEETSDSYNDGEIKGSYVGIMELKKEELGLISINEFINPDGSIEKLESIDVLEENNGEIKAVVVSDNDDGRSKLFFLEIDFT